MTKKKTTKQKPDKQLGIGEIVEKALGKDGTHWSCLGKDGERKLRSLIVHAFPRKRTLKIVEIGTHRGVSACILSAYGMVDTYDVKDWDLRDRVLEIVGPINKVNFHLIPTGEDVAKGNDWLTGGLKDKSFDLAFIDGNHAYESVMKNFRAVKHCGVVIFHDYTHNKFHEARTVAFVNQIPAGRITKYKGFAMWQSLEKVNLK